MTHTSHIDGLYACQPLYQSTILQNQGEGEGEEKAKAKAKPQSQGVTTKAKAKAKAKPGVLAVKDWANFGGDDRGDGEGKKNSEQDSWQRSCGIVVKCVEECGTSKSYTNHGKAEKTPKKNKGRKQNT